MKRMVCIHRAELDFCRQFCIAATDVGFYENSEEKNFSKRREIKRFKYILRSKTYTQVQRTRFSTLCSLSSEPACMLCGKNKFYSQPELLAQFIFINDHLLFPLVRFQIKQVQSTECDNQLRMVPRKRKHLKVKTLSAKD